MLMPRMFLRAIAPLGRRPPIEFQALLGKRITRFESEMRVLTIWFEPGAQLKLHSSEGPYESGALSNATEFSVF